MENNIKEYDSIISLGGNCTAAIQFIQRDLRPCAFPFDYFWLRDMDDLKKMLSELKNNYANSFKKENFVELTGDKRGTSYLCQYQDTISGYNIIHMFHKPIETKGEYEKVYKIIKKRVQRLINLQNKNKDLAFVLSISFEANKEILDELYRALKEKYGEKTDVFYIMWNSSKNEEFSEENAHYIYVNYPFNNYDFTKTNYSWHFLDNCKIKQKFENKYFMICKIKKGIQIKILECINTLFRARFYLLGFRLDICIGKIRD